MTRIAIRYLVDDVDRAVEFYSQALGFDVAMHPGPGFAALDRDGTRLLLNVVGGDGGASQAMPDGSVPAPGGWNRFQLGVEDLDASIEALRARGVTFRGDLVEGMGGRQVLIEDPSGNPVELFEPWPDQG